MIDTSASRIADVMQDIRVGRVQPVTPDGVSWQRAVLKGPVNEMPTIDATEIYRSLVTRNKPISLYEDHECISPPWDAFAIGYVNKHGNVEIMASCLSKEEDEWETDNEVAWSLVRWRLDTLVFIGGASRGSSIGTSGPVMGWRYAIDAGGTPLDLHWEQYHEGNVDRSIWDMAQLVHLGALNFLNCRNVEIVEPQRPRAERRRIERTGQRIHTIGVFPTGRSSRSGKSEPVGVPLTSVRGHFARYGPEYGRAKLFGKYSGRYWIPSYARGSKEFGEVQHDYRLRAEQ